MIIGIAGGSGSGKTFFAQMLKSALSDMAVTVFHTDAYFKSEEKRPIVTSPINRRVYLDDNHPDTIYKDRLLQDVNEARGKNFDVIIIEGLLTLYYEEILSILDLKLFIDCQADERIVRRLRRNMAERGFTFDEIADVYLDVVRYRHMEYVEPSKWQADFILNGSNFSEGALKIIADYVKSKKFLA